MRLTRKSLADGHSAAKVPHSEMKRKKQKRRRGEAVFLDFLPG